MDEAAFKSIRVDIINALCSDEGLYESLVLKGGNALALVHQIGSRTSLDLDFSLEGAFCDIDDMQERMQKALDEHFAMKGLKCFGATLEQKPATPFDPKWLGYQLEFKLIEEKKWATLTPEKRSMQALLIGPGQKRKFTVDFSCHEYTVPKIEKALNDYPVYVYTLDMIAIEKLRALCQQMEKYSQKGYRCPRPRDLYDILEIRNETNFVTRANKELAQKIFSAKDVPLTFLLTLEEDREFHRLEWNSVCDSVGSKLESYDYYFDQVLALIREAEPLWDI